MASGREDEQLGNLTFDDETFGITEAEGAEAYSFSAAVLDQLERLGLAERNQRPVLEEEHVGIFKDLDVGSYFDGRLPTVLKPLSLDQVSALYSLFSAWHAYIITVLNEISVKKSEATNQKEMTWSMVRMKHLKYAQQLGASLSDQRQSDLARYDERFVEANRRYLEMKALMDCVDSLRKIAEKDMDVVSREVTVRQVQIESETRGRGINNPSRFENRYTGSPAAIPQTKRKGVAPRVAPREEEKAKPGPTKKKVSIKRSNIKKGPRKAKRN